MKAKGETTEWEKKNHGNPTSQDADPVPKDHPNMFWVWA